MLATIINSLAIRDGLERSGIPARIFSSLPVGSLAEPYSPRAGRAALERGEGLKQQTDEQQKGKTAVDSSLLQMECGTIHGVGSFVDFGHLVLYQISRGADNYILWPDTQRAIFPPPFRRGGIYL